MKILCFVLSLQLVIAFLAIFVSPLSAIKYRLRNPNARFILQRPRRAGAYGGVVTGTANRAPIGQGRGSNIVEQLYQVEDMLKRIHYELDSDEDSSIEKRNDNEYPIWWQLK